MSSVPKNVSFYILLQDEQTKKIIESGDEKAFKKVLWKWGIDTEDKYEIVSCNHRPIESKPIEFNGPLVQGSERIDSEWLDSGFASWDAKVEAIRDGSLRADLKIMGRQSSTERIWNDEEAAKKYISQEQKNVIN